MHLHEATATVIMMSKPWFYCILMMGSLKPVVEQFSPVVKLLSFSVGQYPTDVEGDTTRTRSEFENEFNENTIQLTRVRDKNVIFILWQWQRFVLYLQKECLSFYFEIDIE